MHSKWMIPVWEEKDYSRDGTKYKITSEEEGESGI